MAAPIVFLDVNETLLDLSALDPLFGNAFGEVLARKQWFQTVLQLALTHTVTGEYRDFSALGRAALTALGQLRQQAVPEGLADGLARTMKALPPHPDTREGLERLREGGARLYALTNNKLDVLEAQLEHAGLRDLLHGALSVDAVRTLKPGRAAYEYGLREAGAEAAQSWLIAAHGWDITGAKAAGLNTAFVERAGQAQNPLARAEVSGGLVEVVNALLEAGA
ncbi:haloacid dehalogenase type II [Deinococcus irradiatisoli]|uniref:Haloacid dehalogenase type II n=1 Tax=Deinococcus irradiatisoli TaxID=2202254 RepID=A0A2Z3JH15_9DEIO|nr:haloacid dehalogenase type II [Deinococcus irradiatisoli]AWN22650.1 haloacid dehalogenase type II [Deinococcus irradiatisoli]